MMRRRAFLVGGVALFAAPVFVAAQAPKVQAPPAKPQPAKKVYRIGHIPPPDFEQPEQLEMSSWSAFVQGLASLGWIEGKNIVFERRTATYGEELRKAAEELVKLKVDVIVLVGGSRAAVVQQVTSTTPIVTLTAGELVSTGVVPSLTRPGANITGMQNYNPELMGKRLQVLKELVPRLTRVTTLRRNTWPPQFLAVYQQPTDEAAQKLGLRMRYVYFVNGNELPRLFADMVKEHDDAVTIWDDPSIKPFGRQILDLAVSNRLATMSEDPDWPRIGALVAYGPKYDDVYRQAATYVDRILKGARPGDLPIGQPSTFELSLNLKTAKALGLTVPQAMLLRADRVIE